MIRERSGHEVTGRHELLRKHPEARQLIGDMAISAHAKITNAIPQRDIPEDIKDAVRTSVRAVRAYMQHLKMPVKLSEKDVLQRCRFVKDDVAIFREPTGHTHTIQPMPAAFHDSLTGLFVIHTPHTYLADRFNLIRILTHEIMHSISHNETRIVQHPSGEIRMIRASGYTNVRSKYVSDRAEVIEERFVGFNEAITDLMALRAIDHARALPKGYIGSDFANDGYVDEKNLVQIISETIAGRIGERPEAIQHIFFEGYIQGTRMHLRMITEHFGGGALHVLSKLGQYRSASQHGGTLNSMIISWFTHELNAKRDELFHEIMAYPTPQELFLSQYGNPLSNQTSENPDESK